MRGILADNSNEGHADILFACIQLPPWNEFWNSLQLPRLTFADLGLTPDAPDLLIWRECQRQEVVLITINRNAQGPESLEVTIRENNSPQCLPVFTLGDPHRVLKDKEYVVRIVERLLEYLLEIDRVRGTGRLYLP